MLLNSSNNIKYYIILYFMKYLYLQVFSFIRKFRSVCVSRLCLNGVWWVQDSIMKGLWSFLNDVRTFPGGYLDGDWMFRWCPNNFLNMTWWLVLWSKNDAPRTAQVPTAQATTAQVRQLPRYDHCPGTTTAQVDNCPRWTTAPVWHTVLNCPGRKYWAAVYLD